MYMIHCYLRRDVHLMARSFESSTVQEHCTRNTSRLVSFLPTNMTQTRPCTLARPGQLARVDKVRRAGIPTARLCAHPRHLRARRIPDAAVDARAAVEGVRRL